LAEARYLPDRGLATAVYLSLAIERPLLLEGEAGVGKTEVGDPELLADQMARLSRLAHWVVWLNPLKGDPAYQPLVRGMRAPVRRRLRERAQPREPPRGVRHFQKCLTPFRSRWENHG
jgi:VWA domain containing CoxE-like protein